MALCERMKRCFIIRQSIPFISRLVTFTNNTTNFSLNFHNELEKIFCGEGKMWQLLLIRETWKFEVKREVARRRVLRFCKIYSLTIPLGAESLLFNFNINKKGEEREKRGPLETSQDSGCWSIKLKFTVT